MKLASRFFIFIFVAYSQVSHAKLLDKIVGIVDSNIITLSQLNRLKDNIAIKNSVAPLVYDKKSYSNDEMLKITMNKFLIRSKLNEIGYTITDDQVESQIKSNQERLGVDKKALLEFLKQQHTSYDEYFETLREAIEFSYFVNRVVQPLISISEQDVKNKYYKQYANKVKMNFKYNLVDYTVDKTDISGENLKNLEQVVKSYRQNAILPQDFSRLEANDLDDISEDGLNPELKALLAKTDEGSFTKMIEYNNQYHIFYVVRKDLVESEAYTKAKESIRNDLFEQAVKDETKLWFERERNKHYIREML